MAPQFVKPYVKRYENDAADAEAICEAVNRPPMRFVPIKNVGQRAALTLGTASNATDAHRPKAPRTRVHDERGMRKRDAALPGQDS
jgi:transposase